MKHLSLDRRLPARTIVEYACLLCSSNDPPGDQQAFGESRVLSLI